MTADHLVLKRPTDHRTGDDFDVMSGGVAVGRIYKTVLARNDVTWLWSIFIEHRKRGRLYKGYAVDREDAMRAVWGGVTGRIAGSAAGCNAC